MLSQFMHHRTIEHWTTVKHLLSYLYDTLDHGIVLYQHSDIALHAFSDVDWAANKDDCTSTSAYIVHLGRKSISWSFKKQQTVARSSTEAEYHSVSTITVELRWIFSLLSELGVVIIQKLVIYCDNVGATNLCPNLIFHSCMKHVDLDYHFIREQVQSSALLVTLISSIYQLGDVLTKSLPRTRFLFLKAKIGLSSWSSILRGA